TVRRSLRFWSFMVKSAGRAWEEERDRALPRPRDGSSVADEQPTTARRTARASGWPPRRTANNSGNSGRRAPAPGRRTAGSARAGRGAGTRALARADLVPAERDRSPFASGHAIFRRPQEGPEVRHLAAHRG